MFFYMRVANHFLERKGAFVAHNMLEACQGWQIVIDSAQTPKEKAEALEQARRAVNQMNDFSQSRNVIAQSELGLAFPSGRQHESRDGVAHLEYSDVVVGGWLGRISFLKYLDQQVITWPVFNPRAINVEEAELGPDDLDEMDVLHLPADREGRLPLHLPVGFIDYAIWTKK
jgi:hypothetical protein